MSMSPISARKLREIVRNAEHVVAIELLCAAQAMDLFTNLNAGEGTRVAYAVIREAIPHLEEDRILAKDIDFVVRLLKSGEILKAVENAVGPLG